MSMFNKKGYSRFAHSAIMFFWMAVIAIVLSIAVSVFYSQEIDVREIEASLIMDKIVDVFDDSGLLREGIICGDEYCEGFNIYRESGLDFEVIRNQGFYFKIEVFDDGNIVDNPIFGGLSSYNVECGLEGKNFPRCINKVLELENYRVEIVTGSNQRGERV